MRTKIAILGLLILFSALFGWAAFEVYTALVTEEISGRRHAVYIFSESPIAFLFHLLIRFCILILGAGILVVLVKSWRYKATDVKRRFHKVEFDDPSRRSPM